MPFCDSFSYFYICVGFAFFGRSIGVWIIGSGVGKICGYVGNGGKRAEGQQHDADLPKVCVGSFTLCFLAFSFLGLPSIYLLAVVIPLGGSVEHLQDLYSLHLAGGLASHSRQLVSFISQASSLSISPLNAKVFFICLRLSIRSVLYLPCSA